MFEFLNNIPSFTLEINGYPIVLHGMHALIATGVLYLCVGLGVGRSFFNKKVDDASFTRYDDKEKISRYDLRSIILKTLLTSLFWPAPAGYKGGRGLWNLTKRAVVGALSNKKTRQIIANSKKEDKDIL